MLLAGVAFFAGSPDVARAAEATDGESDFVTIFDGQSLDGWRVVPEKTAGDWSIKEGVITGIGKENRLSYLVWKEELADFEMKLRYRLRTVGNTGIEIRSRVDKTGKRPYEGYHADLGHVGIGPHILGAWDFHFAKRNEPGCKRGTSLTIHKDGHESRKKIDGALSADDVRRRDWNDVHIIARGRHCQLFVNGKLSSEFTDNMDGAALLTGVIGLQLHDAGMHVEFKDVRLKRLTAK